MYTVVGLGQAGCAIASEFSKLAEYKNELIFRIDSEPQEEQLSNCIDIHLPKQQRSEDYETKNPNLKKHFKKIKKEILFIMAGGGATSMAALAVLEQLNTKNITVLYIRPDIEFLGAEAKLREKLTYNVFQEYARSGMFKRLYIISNNKVEEAMGGVSIINYFEKINQTIVSTFHMMHVLHNSKPVNSTFSELAVATRISTFGIFDLDKNEEKMFFNIDLPTDSIYYFAYNESILMNDINLLNKIKKMVKHKMENGIVRVSYGIYATNYTNTIVLCAAHTSLIQA